MNYFRSLYMVRGIGLNEEANIRGLRNANKEVFSILNSSLMTIAEDLQLNPSSIIVNRKPLPRLFISKNRTLLESARDETESVLVVITDVKITSSSSEHIQNVVCNAILVKPVGKRYDIDLSQWPVETNKNSPKAWIKVKILEDIGKIEFQLNPKMEKEFRKAYCTSKLEVSATDSDYDKKLLTKFMNVAVGKTGEVENTVCDILKLLKFRKHFNFVQTE